MKIVSSCVPSSSIFSTSGTCSSCRADALGVVAQLAVAEAVRGEAVDDPEHVAEVVVEERPDDARRQRVAHVADALAHLVPGVLDLGGRGRADEVDEDRRGARSREAAQEVEVRGFLEPAFEPLGDLLQRLVDGRTGPQGRDDHRPHGEGRILVAAELVERSRPGEGGGEHQVDDERAMLQRPFGEIEPHQEGESRRRIFCPG